MVGLFSVSELIAKFPILIKSHFLGILFLKIGYSPTLLHLFSVIPIKFMFLFLLLYLNLINSKFIPLIDPKYLISNSSQVYFFENDYYNYDLCNFKRSCYSKNEIYIDTKHGHEELNENIDKCCVQKKECKGINKNICKCITEKSRIKFVKFNSATEFKSGTNWMINQWYTNKHNPSHFSFKMVLSGSIFQYRNYYGLPKRFEVMFWQDLVTESMTNFETNIFEIVMNGTKTTYDKIIFAKEKFRICFDNVLTSQLTQVYAKRPEDLEYFRQSASLKLNLSFSEDKSAPDMNAMILIRDSISEPRKFLNMDKVHNLLRKMKISFTEVTISGKNSSYFQAKMFNNFNIIISPHSSQLSNLLFCKKNTIVIELTPYFVDSCFYDLAIVNNLIPIISVGHGTDSEVVVKSKKKSCFFNGSKNFSMPCLYKPIITQSGNTYVNIAILENDLLKALHILKQNKTT